MTVFTGAALAQTTEELGVARGQFQEALSLEVAGDYPAALLKLQQVAQVKLTAQVRYHLARCKENLGRLTEALGDYRLATTEARQGAVPELEEFERALSALESRVPRIAFKLGEGVVSVPIELDGVPLVVRRDAPPLPVDPGVRRIVIGTAHTGSRVRYVGAVERQTIEIAVDNMPGPTAAREAPVKERPSRRAPVRAYVAAGVGAVAIGTSVALFIVRKSAIDTLDSQCSNGVCSKDLSATADRGRFASWAAPTALGIGIGAAALAVWGFWPTSSPAKQSSRPSALHGLSLATRRDFNGITLTCDF